MKFGFTCSIPAERSKESIGLGSIRETSKIGASRNPSFSALSAATKETVAFVPDDKLVELFSDVEPNRKGQWMIMYMTGQQFFELFQPFEKQQWSPEICEVV
jgi:hypothetical protein